MSTQKLTVRTSRQQELVDITDAVRAAIQGQACTALLVYSPHTTAGIVVNEHADRDVARDILAGLDEIVPHGDIYHHAEGNSPAHIKTCLLGTSQFVPVVDGELGLGTWQGIFLAEFDGPRVREVHITFLDAIK